MPGDGAAVSTGWQYPRPVAEHSDLRTTASLVLELLPGPAWGLVVVGLATQMGKLSLRVKSHLRSESLFWYSASSETDLHLHREALYPAGFPALYQQNSPWVFLSIKISTVLSINTGAGRWCPWPHHRWLL